MTDQDYDGHFFCNQNVEEANSNLCKWDMEPPVVGWYTHIRDGELGNLSRNGVRKAILEACCRWEKVCGIKFFEASEASRAHIVIGAGIQNEGPGGTLAWSELPCGKDRQLQQQYDRRERWVIADNAPSSVIDLTRVVCHELGHAIGISHISQGNLMAPAYSRNVLGPKTGDIAQAVARYGRPTERKPEPKPEPEKPVEGQFKIILTVGANGKIDNIAVDTGS